jgi:hypothetical protein
MLLDQFPHDQLARAVTAGTLVLLGVLEILKPGCFWGLSMYFKGTRAALDPGQRERLARVLAARERAEGDANLFMKLAGLFTIGMAALALAPAVPYVLPYALSCLASASAILVSYLRFQRAAERRVAPLARRTPWQSLPPLAIAAAAVCLIGAGSFAFYPQFRVGAIIVIVAALALLAVAYRVAIAPAILFGDDSQLEYLVDEHLRFSRAMNLVSLACAPLTVLVALAWATLPSSAHFFNSVTLAVAVAFVVVITLSLNPIRKRIIFA